MKTKQQYPNTNLIDHTKIYNGRIYFIDSNNQTLFHILYWAIIEDLEEIGYHFTNETDHNLIIELWIDKCLK